MKKKTKSKRSNKICFWIMEQTMKRVQIRFLTNMENQLMMTQRLKNRLQLDIRQQNMEKGRKTNAKEIAA